MFYIAELNGSFPFWHSNKFGVNLGSALKKENVIAWPFLEGGRLSSKPSINVAGQNGKVPTEFDSNADQKSIHNSNKFEVNLGNKLINTRIKFPGLHSESLYNAIKVGWDARATWSVTKLQPGRKWDSKIWQFLEAQTESMQIIHGNNNPLQCQTCQSHQTVLAVFGWGTVSLMLFAILNCHHSVAFTTSAVTSILRGVKWISVDSASTEWSAALMVQFVWQKWKIGERTSAM